MTTSEVSDRWRQLDIDAEQNFLALHGGEKKKSVMRDKTADTHQLVRDFIESEDDYLLRIARIASARLFLDALEQEANRNIKPIDLPLWYVEKSLSYYGIYRYSGIESGSWLLIRDDVPSEQLKWVASCCTGSYWYGKEDGENRIEPGEVRKSHPLYPGFSTYVTIGNKATPAKRYFQGQLSYGAEGIRKHMIERFGPKTWAKGELPRDINGKTIY